ncbi:MAG: hypothetical protein ACRCYU_04245 [Nocardioides sp.]
MTVLVNGSEVARWEPAGPVARIRETVRAEVPLATERGEVPHYLVGYADDAIDLPEPEEGVGFIVSRVTAAAVDRPDLYFPFPEIRDSVGRVAGCGGLARFDHSTERVGAS